MTAIFNPPVNTRVPPFPGGSPQVPSGGNLPNAPSVFVPVSNGGVYASQLLALFPCFDASSQQCVFAAFDPTQGFNDPINPSTYNFRVEQRRPYLQFEIRRIIVTFTDLGQVTAIFTITAVNDQQQIVSQVATVTFGNQNPTGAILTVPVDITSTGMNQQLNITRAADAGPMSIVSILIVGEEEPPTTTI